MDSKLENKQVASKWSLKYDYCIGCKTTARKHKARGLCYKCYDAKKEFDHRGVRNKKGEATAKLTKAFLIDHYVTKQKSLGEIAKECGCTRQLVCIRMKDHVVPLRSKKEARSLALSKKKLAFRRTREDGTEEAIVLNVQKVDETFFKTWSPAMAYVLGVIYTDGNVIAGRLRNRSSGYSNTISRLTITQKEPELLEKVMRLMNCQSTMLKRNKRECNGIVAGEVFYFHVNNETIFEDLIKLGVAPNKSNVVKFPDMPETFVRHFIRGCWDGDGSVYVSNKNIRASYVSGSKDFIESLVQVLYMIGITRKNIRRFSPSKEKREIIIRLLAIYPHEKYPLAIHQSNRSKNPSYSIKIDSKENIEKLFNYLYNGVDEFMYLNRKHDVFLKGVGLENNSQEAKSNNNKILSFENSDGKYSCSVCGAITKSLHIKTNFYCDKCLQNIDV